MSARLARSLGTLGPLLPLDTIQTDAATTFTAMAMRFCLVCADASSSLLAYSNSLVFPLGIRAQSKGAEEQ